MSIVQILGAGGDGGAETYFAKLTTALHATTPQCAALRAHAGRIAALRAAEVEVCTLPFGGPVDIFTKPLLRKFAQRCGASHLVAWMNRAANHTPAGPWARIGRLGGYYKLKNYRGFDALVGNTPDIVRYMTDNGWPADKAHYIPNFAEVEALPPESRARHNTPDGVPLLLAPGRLHPSKAHDVAIAALMQVPRAHLWIAGDGADEDQLHAFARRLGVSDRVHFLGWRADIGALYAACNLVVFPSRFEPLGNVVIEAWATGKPVIAAASQGPGALLRDGVDGGLVPVDDADALARRINAALASPDMRSQWVGAGRLRAKEFARDKVVAQWRDLFAATEAR